MSKISKRRVALMCLFCMVVTVLCGAAFAVDPEEGEVSLPQESDTAEIPLYVDGLRAGSGVKIGATTYISLQAFCEALAPEICTEIHTGDAEAAAASGSETDVLSGTEPSEVPLEEADALSVSEPAEESPADAEDGQPAEEAEADEPITITLTLAAPVDEAGQPTDEALVITAREGDAYMVANGRYFYIPDLVQEMDGAVMVPIREAARAFGVEVVWHEDTRCISVESTQVDILTPGEEFYGEEDLYWLSRIIHAESGNQPLEGMIAVGNVVLNRVADPTCPDTIYEVIFDDRYGVQFSPTETGTIYDEPNEQSVIAAKLCLEGYEVAGASLFFLNPEIGVSSWFTSTRTYVTTIGDHVFYA